jgi:hypothetical protein
MLIFGSRWFFLLLFFLGIAAAAMPAPPQVEFRIVDENGVAVGGAQLTLSSKSHAGQSIYGTSDEAGRLVLSSLTPGSYQLKVEKPGYYAFIVSDFEIVKDSLRYEVILNHRQEFEETVNVIYSAPVIDRQEASLQTTLTSEEIIDLPFAATHDLRQVLPLTPGVVKDNNGRMHIGGGASNQALFSLDGFNVTSAVSGYLDNRISIDAVRNIRVQSDRYSAEYGKGSAGVVALESARGDDRFRFSATNFIPSFQLRNGININDWTPRATVSGPIVKGRAWFLNAADLQHDLNIIDELPHAADSNPNWHGSNLTRLQVSLTRRNLLAASFLVNFQNSRYWGISPLDPVETSRNICERFYFFSVKDQAYLQGGWVLELGVALNRLRRSDQPQGDVSYKISPQGRTGNFYRSMRGREERVQLLTNLMAPPWRWHGRHVVKFGMDANRLRYRQFAQRRMVEVFRLQNSLSRRSDFSGNPDYGLTNSEFSVYMQDHWSPRENILVEAGMRLDRDQILRNPRISPRIALTWGPTPMPNTKFSAGIGVFNDAVSLELITRPQGQQRIDTFFGTDGQTSVSGPIRSAYYMPNHLEAPLNLNWSLGWEQKLPHAVYLRTNFIRKRGYRGWSYEYSASSMGPLAEQASFVLRSNRRNTYGYLEFNLLRTFKNKYPLYLSYARSSAHASAVIDYSVDNPIFGSQNGGPLDWDTPNRLISWAYLPAPFTRKFTITYFLEWHSGFPYSVIDEYQRLVGLPNAKRFPEYFNLNIHCERRFQLWRHQWALRAGFNNITGRQNPTVVYNNLGSPDFGRFSGGQHLTFTGRIRFLGRS